MIPASTVFEVIKIIYEKYQHVKQCKTQCRILVENIATIHQPLETFYGKIKDKEGGAVDLERAMEGFLTILRDAQRIIDKHSATSIVEKVYLTNKFENDFKDINQRLNNIKGTFSNIIGISIVERVDGLASGMNSIAEGVDGLTSSMNSIDITTKETSKDIKDIKNAMDKADERVVTLIENVQKAKTSEVHNIPTMDDSQITLEEEPVPMDRALGMLKKFQPIEIIYNKVIVEDERKLKIMRELSPCEGILTLHGLYEYKGKLYMVAEKPDQKYPTLDLMIKKEVFVRNWGVIRSMSSQLANAIGFMHECKILHKAICTRNICVVKDQNVRIYGLEYARNMSADTDNLMGAHDQVRWTAPERLQNPKPDYDEKCDIYSLGVVMWSLATHKAPFDKLAPREVRTATLEIPKDIPKEFAVIIEGCINKDRKKRWKIERIIDELSKLVPENL